MHIYIPSARRSETIKTPQYLEASGITNYTVLLHSQKDFEEYVNGGRVDARKLLVTKTERGVTHQRRFIINELVKKGEWFITMDDNISGFTGVQPDLYHEKFLPTQTDPSLRSVFEHEYSASEILKLFELDREACLKIGSRYAGFATVPNFYFRSKKYRYVGYIISKAAIICNDGIDYDPELEAMEDFGFCAEHLLTFGRVLINNFLKPTAGHYEKGGIGTYEERLPRKIQDCVYLMNKYPGLFRYKTKKGCHPQAELQFRFTNLSQLEKWRVDFTGRSF